MERTLPWSWYADPEIARREQELIFRRTWQYAGHMGQLPAPSSFFACRAGDVPVVVVRDEADGLRAFLNVCRHRGAQLVDGAGRRETIQCPYHAWTYALDGSLRRAPRGEREPDLDPAAFGLRRVALDRWGPFLFVNTDARAAPLAETLGPLPELVGEAGIDVDDLVFHHRSESRIRANWKVCCENYLECYHCAVAHPGFSALIDVREETYRLETSSALVSTQVGALRGVAAAGAEVQRGQFHFVWPNLTVNIAPGRANLSLGPVLPEGPEETSRFLDYFFAPDADEEWIDELLAWDDQVGAEDVELVERVQRGVRSGMVGDGVLLASERLVARFDQLVGQALAGEGGRVNRTV